MIVLDATRAALRLYRAPAGVQRLRKAALPDGMTELFAVTAGVPEVVDEAAQALGRSPEDLRIASAFFVEQILLASEGDDLRLFGSDKTTSLEDLRTRRKLLMRWLHPDVSHRHVAAGSVDRSAFAARVQAAWQRVEVHAAASPEDRTKREHRSSLTNASSDHRPQPVGIVETVRRYLYGHES